MQRICIFCLAGILLQDSFLHGQDKGAFAPAADAARATLAPADNQAAAEKAASFDKQDPAIAAPQAVIYADRNSVADANCSDIFNGYSDDRCYNGNRNHVWFTAEYLLWQFSNPNAPPLVTTGNNNGGTGPALGLPGTQVLNGAGGSFDNPAQSGVRLGLGFWLPDHECIGIELGAFFFPQRTTTDTYRSGVLGRPFTDALTGGQSTQPVNNIIQPFPGGTTVTNGTVGVNYTTMLWSFDANLRYKWLCGPNFRVDLLAGFRTMSLSEGISISINENLSSTIGGVPFTSPIQVADNFNTSNLFNGGQIGIDAEWRFLPRWSIAGNFKLAMGDVHEVVNISGTTGSNIAGTNGSFGFGGPVGFYAATSNIGGYSRDVFAVLPEVNLKVNFDINDRVRLFVGYNYLYLSNAIRPGNAIDTTVNPNNTSGGSGVGPARPAFNFSNSSFFAEGVSGGIDIHY